MATFICIVKLYPTQTSQTLSATVYDSTNTLVSGAGGTFTELGNGEYQWKVTTLSEGFQGRAEFRISSTYQTSIDISMPAASSVDLSEIEARLDDIGTQVDDVFDAIMDITTSEVSVFTPIVNESDLQLVQGDSYTGSRRLALSSPNWNLSTETLSLEVDDKQTGESLSLDSTLTIEDATTISIQLGSGDTAVFQLGTDRYEYRLMATTGNESVTLVRGLISVAE